MSNLLQDLKPYSYSRFDLMVNVSFCKFLSKTMKIDVLHYNKLSLLKQSSTPRNLKHEDNKYKLRYLLLAIFGFVNFTQ